MTKTAQLLETNLINEQFKNESIYEVNTPISVSIVGEGYPIHDEAGELYTLDDAEMLIKYDVFNDVVGYLINDNVYTVGTSDYEFEVSENERTAFLTLVLTFKLYAKNEEEAREYLHSVLSDNKNCLQSFSIYDGKQDRLFDVDILLYQLSGMYKATLTTKEGM